MAQVIEVRFMNPDSQEVLADEFTKASSHQEAMELALNVWSGGAGTLRDAQREGDGTYVKNGANSCWRYSYRCILDDDKEALAVLFTEYKEK